jgi:hypothetical protein
MCVCCVLGDEEVDEQIRLRDDVIFQLKQHMATQHQRIADLEHIVNELSQIPIKEEGMSIVSTITSACLFGVCVRIIVCGVLTEDDQKDTKPFIHEEKPVAFLRGVKTELKEEPLTLEGEPHALLSVKREIKEEAVPMTKAETTSAQPTTGMSSHSITAIVCGAS